MQIEMRKYPCRVIGYPLVVIKQAFVKSLLYGFIFYSLRIIGYFKNIIFLKLTRQLPAKYRPAILLRFYIHVHQMFLYRNKDNHKTT